MNPKNKKNQTVDEHRHDVFTPEKRSNTDVVSADWDSIIVGSSPLLLLEAIYLGRTGRKVLLLEEMDRLGGAWGHLDVEGFPNLDIGCHYIDISKRAYAFLETRVGLNLVPMRPQPRFAHRRFRVPYDYKQSIRFIRYLKAALKRRELGTFIAEIFEDENYRLRMFPFTRSFLFPRGGSLDLVTKLVEQATENNVDIRRLMRVDSIRFDRERQQVGVSTGEESFTANEIVAGTQARIADALRLSPGPADTSRRVFTHVNLVFRDGSAPTSSYVRFLGDDAVIRMTEITDYVRRQGGEKLSGFRVICIGIRDGFDRSMGDPEKVEQLTELLKSYGFIDASAKCEHAYWNRYPAEFLSDETNEILRDFAPMIRVMATTNFSIGILKNLDRWEGA